MDEIFGVSMSTIMVALVALFVLCLASVAFVALRNRVVLRLALRNPRRRKAQTALVVVGLMLGSLIITAALALGDTIDRSITSRVYEVLGPVDEVISVETEDRALTVEQTFIDESVARQIQERVRQDPNVDGTLLVLADTIPLVNVRSRQVEPLVRLIGVEPQELAAFQTLETVDGQPIDLGALAADEIVINKVAAEELRAEPGDSLLTLFEGEPRTFQVAVVASPSLLAGDIGIGSSGVLLPLAEAQALVQRPGRVTDVYVSNAGGTREGLRLTETVLPTLEAAAAPFGLHVTDAKREAVEFAEFFGNIFTTVFFVMGLFSMAAGVMLIFLIFVMLAAERRSEMGMARAVGMQRSHLVQMFMAEGVLYDLAAAAVGTALGVGTGFGMVQLMAVIFELGELSITPFISVRSLVIAYTLGVVLTFLTVAFSAWQTSRLNIVSAIRDMPEPPRRPQPHRRRGARWMAGGVAAAAVGGGILTVLPPLGISILVLGAGAAVLGLTFVLAGYRGLIFGLAGVGAGIVLCIVGVDARQLAPFALGVTISSIALGFVLRFFRWGPRPVWTAVSGWLLFFWLGTSNENLDIFFWLPELAADFEMFFLSGLGVVISTTLLILYNADVVLAELRRAGSRLARFVPALRTAVSYAMTSRLQTGLSLAMFTLVIFALAMMAIINSTYLAAFASDEAAGGYDVQIISNPNNPIRDLRAALAEEGFDTGQVQAVGRLTAPGRLQLQLGAHTPLLGSGTEVRNAGEEEFETYILQGADQEFLASNAFPLQALAEGYDSDREVWEALAADPSLAVVDALALGGGDPTALTENTFTLEGVDATDRSFPPKVVEVRNPASGEVRELTVIGVVNESVTLFTGIVAHESVVEELYGGGDLVSLFVRLAPGVDDRDAAAAMEAALLERGVEAQSLRQFLDDHQAQDRGFLYLLEGFMALGLIIGVAALGVIAMRSVVERRQQIGVLRAIGFQRGLVSLTFVLEASFVAAAGIGAGIGSALVLSYNLITSGDISASELDFVVPWGEIFMFAGLGYLAALVMTYLPARAAARVPVAEALRYE